MERAKILKVPSTHTHTHKNTDALIRTPHGRPLMARPSQDLADQKAAEQAKINQAAQEAANRKNAEANARVSGASDPLWRRPRP